MPAFTLSPGEGGTLSITAALKGAGLVSSGGEARRMLGQGAVSVDGEKVTELSVTLPAGGPFVLKVGKRRYASITVG